MKNGKSYSWNRNVSHHRIALTKFGVFSFLSAFVAMMGTNLTMITIYDGTKQFVMTTMLIGFLGFLFVFMVMFLMMTVMYRWVCDVDASEVVSDPPTLTKEKAINLYQLEDGNYHLLK